MNSEQIASHRLLLVPFREEHLTERYVGWLNNSDIVRFSEQRHRTHTLESCRDYWRSFQGTPHYFWAIMARDPALGHIGNLNAYVDLANGVADLGILVGEHRVWGQGYGTEAWEAACRYLLEIRQLRKVAAGTMATNRGMLSIMEKTGMVPDGRRIRHFLVEGQEVDLIQAARFRRT